MSILLHKPYLVKWSTKGEEPKKSKICPHDLCTTPCYVDKEKGSIEAGANLQILIHTVCKG